MLHVLRVDLKELSLGSKIELAKKARGLKALDELSRDDNYLVRLEVAKSPSADRETVERLTKDVVSYVREAANANLASRRNMSK